MVRQIEFDKLMSEYGMDVEDTQTKTAHYSFNGVEGTVSWKIREPKELKYLEEIFDRLAILPPKSKKK